MAGAILGGKENFLLWKEKESLTDRANSIWLNVGDMQTSLAGCCGSKPACISKEICLMTKDADVQKQWAAFVLPVLHMWVDFQALHCVPNVFLIPYITMQIKYLPCQNLLMT